MTGAVERSFGVGTVGISMAVVGKVAILIRYQIRKTLINVWKQRNVNVTLKWKGKQLAGRVINLHSLEMYMRGRQHTMHVAPSWV